MPTSLPESVRESWGEPAADDFARWLDEYVQDRAVTRDEYREILSRLDVLENEVAGINERLDRMEERFEDRFGQIDERFNHLEDRFEDRFNHLEKQFEDRLSRTEEQFGDRLNQLEEQFEGRFNKLEERFEGRFNQMENRFNQMDERIDRMHEQMRVMMRWTVGTIALFGTIVTVHSMSTSSLPLGALLAIAEFAP